MNPHGKNKSRTLVKLQKPSNLLTSAIEFKFKQAASISTWI